MRSGDLLVEAASAAQGKCISKLTTLANTAVTVSAHRTLNTSKGVIRCRELIDCDKAEILEELKTQVVSDINNITDVTVKGNDGSRRNTNTFIVTFRLPTLPNTYKLVTCESPLPYTCRICCGALNASDSDMDRKFAGERWCVPNADKLDTQTGIALGLVR